MTRFFPFFRYHPLIAYSKNPTLTVAGVVMVLLGLVHFAGLPLIMEANRSGAINLPSIEEKGIGFHLIREQVANGLLMVGVDR